MPSFLQTLINGPLKPNRRHYIEDSVELRVASSALSIVGVLAATVLAETPTWLAWSAIPAIILGSWLSYKRRYSNNFMVKIWISAGILLVAGAFFKELLVRLNMSMADTRIPLTNMLIALQALHCFDLPRRRDLGLSALVGLTLLASAATLSHNSEFGLYLFVFCFFGILLLRFDCRSRTWTRAHPWSSPEPPPKRLSRETRRSFRWTTRSYAIAAGGVLSFALASIGLFAVMPRAEINLFKHVRVAGKFDLSFLQDPNFNSFMDKLTSGDGSIKANPKAYYGFAETLDTNYRGKLGDQIVLRVSTPIATYWRGMAYDTFDGATWSMRNPKPVRARLSREGALIDLYPVPGLDDEDVQWRFRELTQVFYVESEGSNLVVSAPVPYRIYFPSPNLQLDEYGAVRSPVGIEKDMVYTVVSHVPYRDPIALRRWKPARLSVQRVKKEMFNYLQVPKVIDPAVHELSRKVAGEGGWYRQAERICSYLQRTYKYDLDIEPAKYGRDTVSEFLVGSKTGFCEQFASAFCMMCRINGIPTRLVTGYLPGSYNPLTGMWDVRLSDAHSWAEIFIPGKGWIAFDSTPDGIEGGFSGIEQRSTLSYLCDELERWFGWLSEQLVVQKASPVLRSGFEFFFRIVDLTVRNSGILIGLAVLATVVYYNRSVLKSALTRKRTERKDVAVDPVTSASMNEVLSDLRILKVRREPGDTLDDMLDKTRGTLAGEELSLENSSNGDPARSQEALSRRKEVKARFLSELKEFFDDYAERRYGAKQGTKSLKDLSSSLKEMVGILSKVE